LLALVVWGTGELALSRRAAERYDAAVGHTLAALSTLVNATQNELRREAGILAKDPAIVEGALKSDWATLARGASPRMLALTLERTADLLLVVDASGAPLVQVPPMPRVEGLGIPRPTEAVARVAVVNDRAYLLGLAPLPAGMVVVGRRVESLERLLAGGGAGEARARNEAPARNGVSPTCSHGTATPRARGALRRRGRDGQRRRSRGRRRAHARGRLRRRADGGRRALPLRPRGAGAGARRSSGPLAEGRCRAARATAGREPRRRGRARGPSRRDRPDAFARAHARGARAGCRRRLSHPARAADHRGRPDLGRHGADLQGAAHVRRRRAD